MRQLRNYGDERQAAPCAYCGRLALTRDHVPSRALLDEPYPENLPVVPACRECNQGFAADEEYVACLIDCVLAGSASPDDVYRAKIRRTLAQKPLLAARVAAARGETDGVAQFSIEVARVESLLLKLGRGHALFELNEPQYGDAFSLTFAPLPLLPADARDRFERLPVSAFWPEVGSRAMQRLATASDGSPEWIVVQLGRYRYAAFHSGDAVAVRMVLSEYLACEIVWKETAMDVPGGGDQAEFMNKVAARLDALAPELDAEAFHTGGGILCIRLAVDADGGRLMYWGTADRTWAADLVDAEGAVQGSVTTDLSSESEDAGSVAEAILAAVRGFRQRNGGM